MINLQLVLLTCRRRHSAAQWHRRRLSAYVALTSPPGGGNKYHSIQSKQQSIQPVKWASKLVAMWQLEGNGKIIMHGNGSKKQKTSDDSKIDCKQGLHPVKPGNPCFRPAHPFFPFLGQNCGPAHQFEWLERGTCCEAGAEAGGAWAR